jgi:Excalibur calcium-binding domain
MIRASLLVAAALAVGGVAVYASFPDPQPVLAAAAQQPDLDCSDFDTQPEAQAQLLPGDPFRLDADGDGVACEDLEPGVPPVADPDLQEQFDRSVDPDGITK